VHATTEEEKEEERNYSELQPVKLLADCYRLPAFLSVDISHCCFALSFHIIDIPVNQLVKRVV